MWKTSVWKNANKKDSIIFEVCIHIEFLEDLVSFAHGLPMSLADPGGGARPARAPPNGRGPMNF